MLLYTIVPEEVIFMEEQPENPARPDVEIKMGKVSLIGQPLADGRLQINRVISSDSQDYLNPQWQPGMIL